MKDEAMNVIQADRDAAAACYALSSFELNVPTMMRDGRADGEPFVQAFARRRIAAEARSHDGEWEAIETAPHACHVIAVRFDHDAGEWIYAFVKSPPSKPFTHWRMPPEPPVSAVPLFDEGLKA